MKKLKDYELTLILCSIRYLIERHSILSASFPAEFLANSYSKLSDLQCKQVYEDIKRYYTIWDNKGSTVHKDDPWRKLMAFLDAENRHIIKIDGNEIECFQFIEDYCPTDKYLEDPNGKWSIRKELI